MASQRYLLLVPMVCTAVAFAGASFEPAFGPESIDWALTRQYIDGKASEPEQARVKKTLGFHPADANWSELIWEQGPIKDGLEHTYQFLIVLKAPVAVGTICANAGDPDEYKGSRNGGEVHYLKSGAVVPAELKDMTPWVKVEFPTPKPYLRFAALPPGTTTQAFLYTDVRAAEAARVPYWQFYKARLFNVAPQATGFAEASIDTNTLSERCSWATQRKGGKVSDKNPAWCMFVWDREQTLSGAFLYANCSQFKLFTYDGPTTDDPALAASSSWKPVAFSSEADHLHSFKWWACRYRFLGLQGTPSVSPPFKGGENWGLKTRALKVQVSAVERGGENTWGTLGVFIDLKDSTPPVVSTAKDDRPPFRFPCAVPVAGETTIVVNGADGRRVRNLLTQAPRNQGTREETWDLRDEQGNFVAPGKYQLSGISGPLVELRYQLTPYPNVQQIFPDRVPWMVTHDSPHGWLSDHCQNWACATRGDRVYFGAPMAEAGVCLIECDLDGKKLWGKHDFDPWTGVNMMAADENFVYIDRGGRVYRLDPGTHEATRIFEYGKNPERRGHMSAMAAYGGKVALCFTGEPLLDNATLDSQVELANCLPKPSGKELLHALRLKGRPPGKDVNPNSSKPQGNGKLDIESTFGNQPEQHAVIAFRAPVPLGSVAFANPTDGTQVQFSVLKPGAAYPPRHDADADWTPFEATARAGWNCLPAPANTTTRALRIKFSKADAKGDWLGRLEGLKLLRRRFENVAAAAKVRVSSGAVDANGAWDAKRSEAVCPDRPGVYLMEWDQPQKFCGLALKEVDGAVTEIDVWQGPAAGPAPLDGEACAPKSATPGWRNVATYKQPRRSAQYNDENNRFARYLDGYVDFKEEVETRALRLRVTEQWLDNDNGHDDAACRRHDGRSEHGLHFTQSYAAALDTRLCAILGVAPLKYLRGEPEVDQIAYERVEIYDGQSGALVKELPVRLGWHGLAFNPKGELFGIAKGHQSVVRVDQETGQATTVIANFQPSVMAIGPDNLIYIRPWTDEGRVPIEVYDMQGKLVRKIGKGGGWKPGPWDPEVLGPVHRMCIDTKGNLWLVETDNYPRRIVQFKTDGTFVKEILGNTLYGSGGGGTMNRYDKSRAYYGRVEFEIDWEKHTSRIRGLLAKNLEHSDIVAVRVKDRPTTYLVSAPLSMHPRQEYGCVYIYDEKTGTARLVAAMGDATSFGKLRTSAVISLLKGGVPRDYGFVWSDKNASGIVDADEIEFAKKEPRASAGVGRFDTELGCVGKGVRYAVKEFLADGTPIYERKAIPGSPHLRLTNGSLFTLYGNPPGENHSQDFVTNTDGAKLWGYPAGGGVSGLSIPHWTPGLASNEFSIIGHEVAEPEGLGEFVVVHANTGQWKIWTADGLLAGQVLLHKTDGRAKFLNMPEAAPGMRVDPVTASQEHFHGFFTKTEADGKYYIAFGFTNMSLFEVGGLDRFRRFRTDVEVKPEDIQKQRDWEALKAQKTIASRALILDAPRVTTAPKIDGKSGKNEWTGAAVTLPDEPGISFRVAYDELNLYLCWSGRGVGTLTNSGKEFQRYFKTGAALDFLLGADPNADAKRRKPLKGDLRLLLTVADKQPKVVLYQPVAPGAPAAEHWMTETAAAGKTEFDRVVLLNDAVIANSADLVEVSVPLSCLSLQPKPGLRLKMDWGVLSSNDGRQVKQRQYWANETATGTADEAVEARLEPHLWGHIRFVE